MVPMGVAIAIGGSRAKPAAASSLPPTATVAMLPGTRHSLVLAMARGLGQVNALGVHAQALGFRGLLAARDPGGRQGGWAPPGSC